MSEKFDGRPNRLIAPLFASSFVCVIGAVGVTIVIILSGGNLVAASGLLLFLACCIILGVLLLRVVPATTLEATYSWVRSRHAKPENEYDPKRAATTRKSYGTNHPPTAEEVRELKDGLNNWVPSNTPGRRLSPLDAPYKSSRPGRDGASRRRDPRG